MINTLKKLLQISDITWGFYAFSKDPLNRKLSDVTRIELINDSVKCGLEEANAIRKYYGNLTPTQYAKKMGVDIILEDSHVSHDYIMFAKFNEPSDITIFTKNIKQTIKFMEENKLNDLLEHVNISDMLIAHELFHYKESLKPDIFTKKKHIKLWSVGPFKYKSSLVAPKEIAAMAFAKKILGVSFNPFIFDVLMLYPYDYQQANQILKKIIKESKKINKLENNLSK